MPDMQIFSYSAVLVHALDYTSFPSPNVVCSHIFCAKSFALICV